MTTYANRGMSLESYIEYSNVRYRAAGLAIVEKQNTKFIPLWDHKKKQIRSCKVEEKATVDYLGRFRNIPVAIEAKNTNTDRISFSAVQDHQSVFLDDFIGEYGLGFGAVLVSFKLERFFLVPWQFWAVARDLWNNKTTRGTKETIHCYGMKWTTTGMASVRAEDLLPEWEITQNHKYGLDYLSNIDRYVQPHAANVGR